MYTVNQDCRSLPAYIWSFGRHVARLRRRRAHTPTSNTASHDKHEEIHSWVSFSFPCMMSMGFRLAAPRAAGAPLLPMVVTALKWYVVCKINKLTSVFFLRYQIVELPALACWRVAWISNSCVWPHIDPKKLARVNFPSYRKMYNNTCHYKEKCRKVDIPDIRGFHFWKKTKKVWTARLTAEA